MHSRQRGTPKTAARGRDHAIRVGADDRRAGCRVDQQPRPCTAIVLTERMNTSVQRPMKTAARIPCTFLDSRTWTAVVPHLEEVPRHIVAWESAKPASSQFPSLFVQCVLFPMSCMVNLELKKGTENKYHYGKNTQLFKTLQAV